MIVEDKEIVYTYIPSSIDWVHNRSTYSFELYSILYSIEVFRANFQPKMISLYSTKEICDFFRGCRRFSQSDEPYFDKFVVLNRGSRFIKNQKGGYNHPNMLYKMFTVDGISRPFLHLDNDLFLNNPLTFHGVQNNILFAYEENVINRHLNEQYYGFYFKTYNEIIRKLPKTSLTSLDRFNPMSALNCCIFGGDDYKSIKKSFRRSNEFFIKNYKYLNTIPNIPGFIEQYLQSSYLQEEIPFDRISFLGDLLKLPSDTPRFNEVISMQRLDKYIPIFNYENLDQSLVGDIMEYLNLPINLHLSFIRWYPPYKVAIYNLLKKYNPNVINKLETIYGKHDWCINAEEIRTNKLI